MLVERLQVSINFTISYIKVASNFCYTICALIMVISDDG